MCELAVCSAITSELDKAIRHISACIHTNLKVRAAHSAAESGAASQSLFGRKRSRGSLLALIV